MLPAEINLQDLVEQDPEKAAILLDIQMKTATANERESWINRAQIVYFLKESNVWQHHPAGFSSWNAYIQQPEIDIAPCVASDMVAICTYAPHLQDAEIDIWQVIRDAGPSKVRQIIPQIREAHREGVLKEQITPVIAALDSMSFREVLELTATSGVRTSFAYDVIYEEDSEGRATITFSDIDTEDVEFLAKRANIRQWRTPSGQPIESPVQQLGRRLPA